MPELPEVHTISTQLEKYVTGYTIDKIAIAPKYKVLPDNKTFIKGVLGTTIEEVTRVGKNVIISLNSGMFIRVHLAMTGRLLLRDPDDKEDKWVRVLFLISKYADEKHLRFTDMRMFGRIELIDKVELEQVENIMGIDFLDDTLTPDRFLEKLKSKRTNIKNILLNQKLFSGLGNIYVNEALFRAKIHPETKTTDLDRESAETILIAAKNVLSEGIENRGSTLPDKMYVDIFGKEGSFQEIFNVYLQRKCKICDSEISYIKLNGRGTYFCPVCQPISKQKSLITEIEK